eukprot:gene13979-biopygen10013
MPASALLRRTAYDSGHISQPPRGPCSVPRAAGPPGGGVPQGAAPAASVLDARAVTTVAALTAVSPVRRRSTPPVVCPSRPPVHNALATFLAPGISTETWQVECKVVKSSGPLADWPVLWRTLAHLKAGLMDWRPAHSGWRETTQEAEQTPRTAAEQTVELSR